MLGVQVASCYSGWAQTGSLGVKKRLGGWRNHSAGRYSLCVHMYIFTFVNVPSGSPTALALLATSISRENNPRLCEHLQPRPTLPSLLPHCLCFGSACPLGNANCQRRCFMGLWALCALRLSVLHHCQVNLTLLRNHRCALQDPGPRANKNLSLNLFMKSVWKKRDNFDHFPALFQNYRNETFPNIYKTSCFL